MTARANYFFNPRFDPGGTAWGVNACTVAQDTVTTVDGVPSGHLTITDNANTFIYLYGNTGGFGTFQPGVVVTFSARVESAKPTIQVRWRVTYRNASGSSLVGNLTGAYTSVGNGTSVVYTPPTAPADTSYIVAYLQVNQTTVANGDELWIAKPLLEDGPTAGNYFDGTYPNAEWTGTPHASRSVLTLPDAKSPSTSLIRLGSSHIGPLRVGKD